MKMNEMTCLPVILSLQEAKFFLDTIARLGNGELEGLTGLMGSLNHTTIRQQCTSRALSRNSPLSQNSKIQWLILSVPGALIQLPLSVEGNIYVNFMSTCKLIQLIKRAY